MEQYLNDFIFAYNTVYGQNNSVHHYHVSNTREVTKTIVTFI